MRKSLEKIAYIAIRIAKGNVYFFDKEGIYRRVSVSEAKEMNLRYLYVLEDDSIYIDLVKFIDYIPNETNQILIRKIICKLIPGDEIEKFEEYLQTVKIEVRNKPKGLDRFITKIQKPYFIRSTQNTNTNTFDYINIDVNIVSEWEEDRKEYIIRHREEIWQRVISKLRESREFKKYGVPVNFLKANMTITKSSILKFTFELKNADKE